jgi:hypothetical protein
MILATARGAARRGQQVILVGPSDELRAESRSLDIFSRVQTRPGSPTK